MPSPHVALTALSAFFAFGAVASATAAVTLALPGTFLDQVWVLNPRGHQGLLSLGPVGIALMAVVCTACLLAARGIWIRALWGHRLAVTILVANGVADLLNALGSGDRRTLIGVPIAAVLITFLLSPAVKATFRRSEAAV